MQHVLRWLRGIEEYIAGFGTLRVEFPQRCAGCGCSKFYRWGKYERNLIDDVTAYRVPIRRVCCTKCRGTVSYLPDFCISRVQYSVSFVMGLLQWLAAGVGPAPESAASQEHIRRRGYAYRRRFERGESLWLTFLRGLRIKMVPPKGKARTRELFFALRRLWEAGELLCGFNSATGRHFMAG